jgi:integrase
MPRRTLTAETIGRIKPGATRLEVADAVLPGLRLIIQPSGARSFAVRTRVGGKTAKLTLGPWPAIDLAKARELARAKLQEIATGIDPRQAEREAAQAARLTVAAVCNDWLRRDQADNKDVANVARIMEREVLPYIGEMQIEAVRKRDLIAVIDRVADRAPVRANRVLAHLKRLFRWAAGRDVIDANPASSIERPTAERARERVLNDPEIVAIWRAAERLGGPIGAGIKLLMLTGARFTEIFQTRWSEIHGNALRLPTERAKSKEGRTIWLSPEAQEIVASLPRFSGSDWVLTTNGRHAISRSGDHKARLDRLVEDPLPAWRLHDLRRTVATGLQRLGVRLEVIETVLGHVSGSRAGIVGTYQRHRFEVEAAEAVRRWGEHVQGLLDPALSKVVTLRRTGR